MGYVLSFPRGYMGIISFFGGGGGGNMFFSPAKVVVVDLWITWVFSKMPCANVKPLKGKGLMYQFSSKYSPCNLTSRVLWDVVFCFFFFLLLLLLLLCFFFFQGTLRIGFPFTEDWFIAERFNGEGEPVKTVFHTKKAECFDGTGVNARWTCFFYMGVSKNRGTPKWMVYNGNPY